MNEFFFFALLANAVCSGYDRGERCLSAICFVMFTCWNVQFSKIFAFLVSQRINFYFKAKLVLRENSEFIVRDSELIRLLESPRSFGLCMLKK